jgi:hypothetical protein
MYVGEQYSAVCQLCYKSWIKRVKVYQISYPHPAIQGLTKDIATKKICYKCAKREEPRLFKNIQEEI